MQFIHLYLIEYLYGNFSVIFRILGKLKEPKARVSTVGSDIINSFNHQ